MLLSFIPNSSHEAAPLEAASALLRAHLKVVLSDVQGIPGGSVVWHLHPGQEYIRQEGATKEMHSGCVKMVAHEGVWGWDMGLKGKS